MKVLVYLQLYKDSNDETGSNKRFIEGSSPVARQ